MKTKEYLQRHLVTKDMGKSKIFPRIEFTYGKDKMALSQRMYVLDLLQETGLLGCRPETTLVDQNLDFWDYSKLFEDVGRYRKLIGKLIYLTITHPDISYVVGLLSQFLHEPQLVHWRGALRILAYIKETLGKGLV